MNLFEEIELRKKNRPTTWFGWVDFLCRERQRILLKRTPSEPQASLGEKNLVRYIAVAFREGLREYHPDAVVAYAGSTALWVQNHSDTYNDLDLFTSCVMTRNEFIEMTGFPVDAETKIGIQSWNLNLDVFFRAVPDASFSETIQLGTEHIIEVDGIPVQTANYIYQYNWVFNEFTPDWKNRRKDRPLPELEMRIRSAFEQCKAY